MKTLACFVLILAAASAVATAAPIYGIASPDQATRDAAAKILRASYLPTPRAKWKPLLASLKPGMTRGAFEQLVAAYHPHFELGDVSGGASHDACRLDDAWVLSLDFALVSPNNPHPWVEGPTNPLVRWNLIKSVRNVWVTPPKNFTGTWINYYANGQKESEISYRDGAPFGACTRYDENGTKTSLQRYDAGGVTDETDYYPSGRVRSRMLISGGFSHTMNFREDGSVASTEAEPDYVRTDSSSK